MEKVFDTTSKFQLNCKVSDAKKTHESNALAVSSSFETDQRIESELLNSIKGPLFCAQMLGYVPLTMNNDKALNFNPLGLLAIYCYAFILASATSIFYFIVKNNEITSKYMTAKSTDKMAQAAEGLFTAGFCIYLKIRGIYSVKKTLRFWKGFIGLFTFANLSGFLHSNSDSLEILRKDSVLTTSLHVVPILVYQLILLCSFGFSVFSSEDSSPLNSWTHFLFLIQWSLVSFFHVAHKLWILIFIKMYSMYFELVAKELQNFNLEDVENQDQYDKQGKIKSFNERHLIADAKLKPCLSFIKKIEDQIEDFNVYFGTILVLEVLLCILKIVTYTYFGCMIASGSVVGFGKDDGYSEIGGKASNNSSGNGNASFQEEGIINITTIYLAVAVVGISVPALLYSKSLFDFGTAASVLSERGRKIGVALESLSIMEDVSSACQKKIMMLNIRYVVNPPCINPRNFFLLNRSLITSIIGALSTYLIVLVQFRDSEK